MKKIIAAAGIGAAIATTVALAPSANAEAFLSCGYGTGIASSVTSRRKRCSGWLCSFGIWGQPRRRRTGRPSRARLTASLGTLWAYLLELIERHLRRQASEEFR